MKALHTSLFIPALTISSLLWMSPAAFAVGETNSSQNAQELLHAVKQRGLERQVTAKQTELDRLREDLEKGRKENERLQQSLESVAGAIKESSSHLEQLASQRTRVEKALELIEVRIEAERQKLEGLKLLSESQNKAANALTKQSEETDLRISVGSAEMKQISAASGLAPIAASGQEDESPKDSEIALLRKKLEKSEIATSSANKDSRQAMQAAARKLQSADTAAVRAKKKALDLGLEETSDAVEGTEMQASGAAAAPAEKSAPETTKIEKPAITP